MARAGTARTDHRWFHRQFYCGRELFPLVPAPLLRPLPDVPVPRAPVPVPVESAPVVPMLGVVVPGMSAILATPPESVGHRCRCRAAGKIRRRSRS